MPITKHIIAATLLIAFFLTPSQAEAFDFSARFPKITIPTIPPMPTFPTNRNYPSNPISPTPFTAPTAGVTQYPTPTASKITPTPTRIPVTSTPRPTSYATPTSDTKKTYIMQQINDYRARNGLSPVKTDPYTCSFAKIRAKEISTDFSHTGFEQRVRSKTLPYPSYSLVTENLAMTSDYRNVVRMWISSSGHAANMRKDTPYVCVESYGNYYAYLGWRP